MKKDPKNSILKLVREGLEEIHIGDITVHVVDGDIELLDDWWHVTVCPSKQPPSMHQFYEQLINVESDLQLNHQVKVWLVPTVPD